MLNSQDRDDPSFHTHTPEWVEVAVVETERSQLSNTIAVHLCLQTEIQFSGAANDLSYSTNRHEMKAS